MSKYHIKHITRYSYPSTVIDSANQLMLFPIDDAQQEVKHHAITITQQPSLETFVDYFGNRAGVFYLIKPHTELRIESAIEIIIHEVPLPPDDTDPAMQWEHLHSVHDQVPYLDFLTQEHFDARDEATGITREIVKKTTTPFKVACTLSTFVYDHFEYKKGITNVETKVDEIWRIKAGVCQDFAHILLVMLRFTGIPARYVSGYICPKDHELRGEGATHAWVEAYIPFYGWVGLDPTNNCIVGDRHVRLAIGRSFLDCTPVKGTYKGSSEHTLEVSVTIENGQQKRNDQKDIPVFTYQVHHPGEQDNSYRRFVEMQQQQ